MFFLLEFHVTRTVKNARSTEGAICCFHVNQNFVLTDFVLSGSTALYCTALYCTVLYYCIGTNSRRAYVYFANQELGCNS